MQLISAWDLIVKSWQLFAKNYKTMLGIAVWLFIPIMVFSLISFFGENNTMAFLMILFMAITIVISVWISIVLIETANKFYRNESPDVGKLYKTSWSKFWPLVWVSILVTLAIIGGLILLIIPGIIFGVWFSFSYYYLILENKKGAEALKLSKQLVQGKWWAVLWRWLATTVFYGIIIAAILGIVMAIISIFIQPQTLAGDIIYVTINNLLSVGFTTISAAIGVILFNELKKYKAAVPAPETASNAPGST